MDTGVTVKSKLALRDNAVFFVVILLFLAAAPKFLYILAVKEHNNLFADIVLAVFLLFVLGMIIGMVLYLRWRVVIDGTKRTAVYYSLRHPHGKVIMLDKYVGYCLRRVSAGRFGSGVSVYLAASDGTLTFLISLNNYTNGEELVAALGLNEVSYRR